MSLWCATRRPAPQAEVRLFCFPYAGAGALVFRPWAAALPAWIELCPVQLPGREARLQEPPFTEWAPLVEAAGRGLSPDFDKPFAFFGHSMGALLAFELTRWLRRQGGPSPVHLFLSGREAPRATRERRWVHDLPEVEFLAEMRHLNGTPPEVLAHAALMEMLAPMLRADFSIGERYVYGEEAPLACPVTALGGRADPSVEEARLAAWRAETSGPFAMQMFSGDHFFINSARPLLLERIAQDLRRSASPAVAARSGLNQRTRVES
jgi:medium-chain acyl-[acyl-carrier-protein] hydrolase